MLALPRLLRRSAALSATARRSVWSTGTEPPAKPQHSLSPSEVSRVSSTVKASLPDRPLRFVAISLQEAAATRAAEVVVLQTDTGVARELVVELPDSDDTVVSSSTELPVGVQPLLTPEDCDLAEMIAKESPVLQAALLERYGITDVQHEICADPWSVHLASDEDAALTMTEAGEPRRLVQTFLYQRVQGDHKGMEDNHYAHPIDILPIVDLNSKSLVRIDGLDRTPAPKIPQTSVQYHRNLLSTNEYLAKDWRKPGLANLDIVQPDGPSFAVSDGNLVEWQNWTFRVGFNYREGLVLHDVCFDGRSVLKRGALVEMAVPYVS